VAEAAYGAGSCVCCSAGGGFICLHGHLAHRIVAEALKAPLSPQVNIHIICSINTSISPSPAWWVVEGGTWCKSILYRILLARVCCVWRIFAALWLPPIIVYSGDSTPPPRPRSFRLASSTTTNTSCRKQQLWRNTKPHLPSHLPSSCSFLHNQQQQHQQSITISFLRPILARQIASYHLETPLATRAITQQPCHSCQQSSTLQLSSSSREHLSSVFQRFFLGLIYDPPWLEAR
jgi:hypothetical protein